MSIKWPEKKECTFSHVNGMCDCECCHSCIESEEWNACLSACKKAVAEGQPSGLVELPDEEWKTMGIDLLDEFFPKGQCKERGQAIVMFAKLMLDITKKYGHTPAPKLPSEEEIEIVMCQVQPSTDFTKRCATAIVKYLEEK